jgi:hypothetical protein
MYKEKLDSGEINEIEFREMMAEKVITFFERTEIFEKCQDLLKSENITENISFDDFKDFLIRINGLLREVDIKDRDFDGRGVVLLSMAKEQQIVGHEDKEGLLLHAYKSLKDIKKEDLKYFMPIMINAIHLFLDGNGRTARIFNLLLKEWSTKKDFYDNVKKVLSFDNKHNDIDIKPRKIYFDITKFLMQKEGISFEENNWPPILPKELFGDNGNFIFSSEKMGNIRGKELLNLYASDPELVFLSMFKYLKDKNLLVKCIETNNELGGIKALSPALMEFFLTEDDFENMIRGYFDLLRERIQVLVDSFVQPEEYSLIDGTSTMKDKLLRGVKNK